MTCIGSYKTSGKSTKDRYNVIIVYIHVLIFFHMNEHLNEGHGRPFVLEFILLFVLVYCSILDQF